MGAGKPCSQVQTPLGLLPNFSNMHPKPAEQLIPIATIFPRDMTILGVSAIWKEKNALHLTKRNNYINFIMFAVPQQEVLVIIPQTLIGESPATRKSIAQIEF